MPNRRIAALVVGALVLGGAALGQALGRTDAPAVAGAGAAPRVEAAPAAITVAAVAPRILRDRIVASGLVVPEERVFAQPEVEGLRVEAILVDLGERVAAGQTLARLSDAGLELERSRLLASRASAEATVAQAEAQLAEAEAAAAEAGRERDRARALRERGAGTGATADRAETEAAAAAARVAVARQGLAVAEAQRAVAEAQIGDVELRLRRTEVKAPVAGEVVARDARLGAVASAAGAPMFEIVRDGLLELRAEVAEGDVLRLAPGQRAVVRAVGRVEPLAATVRLVEPTIDPDTRLGHVRVALDASEAVRPGLFARAEILVAEREAPAIPLSAVSEGDGPPTALVVDADGVVERREIRTGIRDGDHVEILAGLASGERVVARAGAFVRPGGRVAPVPADGADAARLAAAEAPGDGAARPAPAVAETRRDPEQEPQR